MRTPSVLLRLLLLALAAAALLIPAAGTAAEPGAGTTETQTIPLEATPPTTGTEALPTTSTPQQASEGADSGSAARGPEVQAGHSQGSSPAPAPRNKAKSGHEANGSSRAHARTRKGPLAALPSTLTPPLPLSLGGAFGGIPSFFIESFRVPPFLLPIFQAAGSAYGVPWQVLAAINEIETDYGRDVSVSTAGAEGWMQFLPSSWATYGVDANGDGFRDPYNPADAIFAAARYLRAADAATNIRGAVFAYNHSQGYVESVLLRAKLLGGTPAELLGAITGLTQARFPVHAASHFSDGFATLAAAGAGGTREIAGTTIFSGDGAPVIAVQDGKVVQIGSSAALGRFIVLRDAYGNTYYYSQLGSIAHLYPVLVPRAFAHASPAPAAVPAREPRPTEPASAGAHPAAQAQAPASAPEAAGVPALSLGVGSALEPGAPGVGSAPAAPTLAVQPGQASAGGAGAPAQGASEPSPAGSARSFRAGEDEVYLRPLRAGVTVIAGTVLGHIGATTGSAAQAQPASSTGKDSEPHMLFQIRPAGAGAPLIDPKPILDGWVALENSSIFRAKGRSPFDRLAPSPGQVLLESKEQLERQVLANSGIDIYACGRGDIEAGLVDRRVLATLEFLAVSGLEPTVSALKCGHAEATNRGAASEHAAGDAVDISRINGVPIAGHQGRGSIADRTIRKLLTLQGSVRPHQIISLMRYPRASNTLARADHFDRIHVGFRAPAAEVAGLRGALSSSITPGEWIQLIARLGEIPNPTVSSKPSAAAIPVRASAGTQSGGEAHG
jgi:murein DD-endopeptidase MepM/ murein hydrolase activator NlpD